MPLSNRPPWPPAPEQSEAPSPQDRSPWRVEGSRKPPTGGPQSPRPTGRYGWIWWMALVLLLINWTLLITLGANTRPTTPRLNLPSSVFRAQVQAGNVESVTATGETIEGQLRRAIRYPPDSGGPASEEFKTQRQRMTSRHGARAR
jgi:hypothetical protein